MCHVCTDFTVLTTFLWTSEISVGSQLWRGEAGRTAEAPVCALQIESEGQSENWDKKFFLCLCAVQRYWIPTCSRSKHCWNPAGFRPVLCSLMNTWQHLVWFHILKLAGFLPLIALKRYKPACGKSPSHLWSKVNCGWLLFHSGCALWQKERSFSSSSSLFCILLLELP